MDERIPRYIAVEGPIGVGKTTLVEALAQRLQARVLLEQFEENPFLPLFYRDQQRYALQTEMFFLLGRFRQQEEFLQSDLFQQYTVSDYIFPKCRLFATITLDNHELTLFDQFYHILERDIPAPDLVIHLHAPVETLLARIQQRGRSYESEIDPGYLEQVSQLYVQEFARPQSLPSLSIDTTDIDFRKASHVDRLLALIGEGRTGRISPEEFQHPKTSKPGPEPPRPMLDASVNASPS